eukprot:SAG11_NODE_6337_length_1333_cov_1.858185_2_plen_282_part_00
MAQLEVNVGVVAPLKLKLVTQTLLAGVAVGALLPAQLHTDFIAAVIGARREQTGRGKPIKLPAARLATLNAALLQQSTHGAAAAPLPGTRLVGSLAQLRTVAGALHVQERRMGNDGATIAKYYDTRACGYDSHCATSSSRLTQRVLELAAAAGAPWLQPGGTGEGALLLDLGSGTGLSSAAVRSVMENHGCGRAAVLGCDVSLGMLAQRRGRDEGACACDLGTGRLPFRDGGFDGVVSVAALHYLCHDLETPQGLLTCSARCEMLLRSFFKHCSTLRCPVS